MARKMKGERWEMNENFCKELSDAIGSQKVVIYGAGNNGAMMLSVMDELGKEVLYFLDKDPDKQKSEFWGYKVKSPAEILYEDMSKIIVVIAISKQGEVENELADLGLKKGSEFIHGRTMQCARCDTIDPLLGYSRSYDVRGFKVWGEAGNKRKKNIICLGGSTTDYSFFDLKSWPKYLFDLFERDNCGVNVLNGGIAGYTSSQELLKLIRDGLELSPSLVISYSGVNDLGVTPTMGNSYLVNVLRNMVEVDMKSQLLFLGDNLLVADEIASRLDSAEYWYRNEKIMCSICCGFSIPFIGILQPTSFTKPKHLQSLYEQRGLFKMVNGEYRTEQFEKAKRLIEEDENIFDFTSLFDKYKNIYVDFCHVFEEGNKIIAESIYQIIKERKILDI